MAKRVKFLALLNSDRYKPKLSETAPLLTPSPSSNDILSDVQKKRIKDILQGIEFKEVDRDKILRVRHTLILINTIISLILMIAVLQLEWDGTELREDTATYTLKLIICTLTLVLLAQICEVYWKKVSIESKRSKESSTLLRTRAMLRSPNHPDFYRIEKKKASVMTVLRTTNLLRKFLLEFIVSIPCPVPFFSISLTKEAGLLMFLRLYIVSVVIRDYSQIYRRRKIIERIRGYSPGTHPNFNTFLSMKVLFFKYPVQFVCSTIGALMLVIAYGIYIFEREAQPELWNYWISIYLSVNCLFTGWGSDTFDTYDPITWPSKILCLTGVVVGVFWFALLIDYVHSRMQPDRFQLTALEWLDRTFLYEKQRDLATRVIQLIWRYQRWKRFAKRTGVSKSERKKRSEEFTVKYLHLISASQRLRRQKQRDFANVTAEQPQLKEAAVKVLLAQASKDIQKSIIKQVAELLEQQKREILYELRSDHHPVVKLEKEEEEL